MGKVKILLKNKKNVKKSFPFLLYYFYYLHFLNKYIIYVKYSVFFFVFNMKKLCFIFYIIY